MVRGRIGPKVLIGIAMAVSLAVLAGCSSMMSSKPIMPVKEYEKLIVGRIDADYVGDNACLSKCHEHDQIKTYFDASTMGAQLSPESGLPLVNCESCHGPGSLAISGIKTVNGKPTCDFGTFIDLNELPKEAQSLICLKCHSANATFNLHNWNAGSHNLAGVSCFDCHRVHQGADLKVHPKDVAALCEGCHSDVKAQFMLPSHHAVPEGRVSCLDCHDPHGTAGEKLLTEATVKETCTNCHAEKEGPFSFEHADLMEDCGNCHKPHGTVNEKLLNTRMPFLCYQCHESHRVSGSVDRSTRCTDCHSEIHGTDTPGSGRLPGTFLR